MGPKYFETNCKDVPGDYITVTAETVWGEGVWFTVTEAGISTTVLLKPADVKSLRKALKEMLKQVEKGR